MKCTIQTAEARELGLGLRNLSLRILIGSWEIQPLRNCVLLVKHTTYDIL